MTLSPASSSQWLLASSHTQLTPLHTDLTIPSELAPSLHHILPPLDHHHQNTSTPDPVSNDAQRIPSQAQSSHNLPPHPPLLLPCADLSPSRSLFACPPTPPRFPPKTVPEHSLSHNKPKLSPCLHAATPNASRSYPSASSHQPNHHPSRIPTHQVQLSPPSPSKRNFSLTEVLSCPNQSANRKRKKNSRAPCRNESSSTSPTSTCRPPSKSCLSPWTHPPLTINLFLKPEDCYPRAGARSLELPAHVPGKPQRQQGPHRPRPAHAWSIRPSQWPHWYVS